VRKDWVLTQDDFDRLLTWLDKDPDQAGAKYEYIRRALVKMFVNRECANAEDLADETINRVTAKLEDIIGHYVGQKELYFYGVARIVLKEYKAKSIKHPACLLPEPEKIPEEYYTCLEKCLTKLSELNRELVLKYYLRNKQAKIDYRKELAESLGISSANLRMRVCRIRNDLRRCISRCIKIEK
jgi:DNA-directed RNA polymerase specialized sigma24 family protein